MTTRLRQMGLLPAKPTPPKAYGPLDPFDPPLGLSASYSVNRETVLTIKSRSRSRDFDITDASGNVVVLCEGKPFSSLSSGKVFKDPQTGAELFEMGTEPFSTSYWGINPAGLKFIEIIPRQGIANIILEIYFDNTAGDSAPVELFLQADDRENKRAQITHGDRTVAWISHDTRYFSSTPYEMTVAPGVDLALMAALCRAWDYAITGAKGGPGLVNYM